MNVGTRNTAVIEMDEIDRGNSSDTSNLSDIDRGLLLLSNTLFAHSEQSSDYTQIVKDLMEANERHEQLLEAYHSSQKRWRIWKWLGIALEVSIVSATLFVDLYDRLLSPQEVGRNRVLKILTPISSAGAAASAAFSVLAYLVEGKRLKQYEDQLSLQESDKELVKKLHMILENWGALQRAQENERSEVDTHESARKCFKHIKSLPHDERLPPKSHLASMTLMLLDDDHPAKQAAHKIKEFAETLFSIDGADSGSQGFQDVGQKAAFDAGDVRIPSPREHEEELSKYWAKLKQAMAGLYIDEIYHNGALLSRRPLEAVKNQS